MSDLIRRTRVTPVRRWRRRFSGIALACLLAPVVAGQEIGRVDTLGGTGERGLIDGVKGTSEFRAPTALALRGDGYRFIADYDNNAVRSLRLSDT